MSERVVTEGEISLNGNYFKLTRPVQATIASQYPARVLTGEISGDSQQGVSQIRWSDARGGIGKKDHEGAADVNRLWYGTSHLRVNGHRTLPDRVISTAATGITGVFTIGALAELANEIYLAASTTVLKLDFDGDSWGSSLHTLPAAATDAITARWGGTVYMVFAHTGGTTDTTDGSTFSDRTADALYLADWDDRIWAIDNTGQLRWAFDPTGSFTNDAQLPLPNGYVKDLFVARDAAGEHILYASTAVGLYAHDAGNNAFVRTEVKRPFHNNSGAGVVEWRGSSYIPAGLGIYKYNIGGTTAVQTVVGPDRDQGLPSDRRGTIIRLEETHNDLLVLVDDTSAAAEDFDTFISSGVSAHSPAVVDTEAGRSLVLGWNEVGWQVLFESSTNEQSIDYSLVSNAYSGYRFWFAQNELVKYFALPVDVVNPSELSDREYADSSRDESPWFDAGQAEVDKIALRLRVEVTGASSDETIAVYYGLDYDDATWTSLGTITSNGVTTYDFPNSTTPTGIVFRSFRWRTDLANGSDNSLSPDVRSITVEYRKKLPLRSGWSVEIDLNHPVHGKTSAEQRAGLLTSAQSNALVEFTFRDDAGDTRNYFIDVVQLTGLEFTGHNEGGITRLVLAER